MLESDLKRIEDGIKFHLALSDKVKFGLAFDDMIQVKDYIQGKGYSIKILAESIKNTGIDAELKQCKYYALVRRKQ